MTPEKTPQKDWYSSSILMEPPRHFMSLQLFHVMLRRVASTEWWFLLMGDPVIPVIQNMKSFWMIFPSCIRHFPLHFFVRWLSWGPDLWLVLRNPNVVPGWHVVPPWPGGWCFCHHVFVWDGWGGDGGAKPVGINSDAPENTDLSDLSQEKCTNLGWNKSSTGPLHFAHYGPPVASSIAYDDRQSLVGDLESFACALPSPSLRKIHPHEQWSKPTSDIPLNWLLNRDPYNSL